MANFTFEQLMNMDIFSRAEALEKMTESERKQLILPANKAMFSNKLQEAMARTPVGKHLAEI